MQVRRGPRGERNKTSKAVAQSDIVAGVTEHLNEGKDDAGHRGPANACQVSCSGTASSHKSIRRY